MLIFPTFDEIKKNLAAAFGLFWLRAEAIKTFENTPVSFWKSFGFAAQLLVLSTFLSILLFTFGTPFTKRPLFEFIIIDVSIYAIGLALWPLAAHSVCLAMDCDAEYPRYICALNWLNSLITSIWLSVSCLHETGIISRDIMPRIFYFLTFWPIAAHTILIVQTLKQPWVFAIVMALGRLIFQLSLMFIYLNLLRV